MKTDETEPTSSGASPQQTAAGVSRRQLVRAGLSAAPVLAVLKSNSVLAASNAVPASAFASLQANQGHVSHTGLNPTVYKVITPAVWLANLSPELRLVQVKDYGFVPTLGGRYETTVTVEEVLQDTDPGNVAKLARYVVASYLTAHFYAATDNVVLSTLQCKDIWGGQGAWSPFAGAHWTQAQTLSYFETIYS